MSCHFSQHLNERAVQDMLKKLGDDNCIRKFFVTLHPHLTTVLSQQKIKIKMKDFAAIDFETANFERTSVCAVGVVVVRDGRKVDTFYSLIHPEPNYYNYRCSSVNGLCREDTEDAPVFPDVWRQIEPKIEGLPLVAHNKAFDENCLKAVFRMYQMDYPDYPFYCTLIRSRQVWPAGHHNLDIIAERCGYDLKNHHHALADAEACAAIALKIL